MNYRVLGRTGLSVSVLGFGCMRLPLAGQKVDDRLAIPLLRKAVEQGINYFDSAVFYCFDDSQRAVGDALHDLRDRIILSTKNDEYRSLDAWRKNLETSLRLMRTDYLDVYHFHGLSWDKYNEVLLGKGFLEAMFEARDQGLVRHIAYSCHDTPENNIRLAETGHFESCLMQYSLLDRKNEPVINRLSELGVGVAIMGPVAGGRLAGVQGSSAAAESGLTSAQTALKWVLSNPNVCVALSGMSSIEMLEENLQVASQDLSLSNEDLMQVAGSQAQHEGLTDFYCTSCGYCMPCPTGVNIPENFTLAHLDRAYGMTQLARQNYAKLKGKARYCLECGKCLEKCPQKLDIPRHMQKNVDRLDAALGNHALEVSIIRVEPVDNQLKFHFSVAATNLTEEAVSGNVMVDLAGHSILQESVKIKPRKHKSFQFTHAASPQSIPGTVRYRAVFEGAQDTPEIQADYPLLFAHRVEEGATLHPDQIFVCGAKKLADGNAELLTTHRLGFRIARNDEYLLLVADVEEDGLHAQDGLELFLDCRSQSEYRQGPFQHGCAHVRLLAGDESRLQVMTSNGPSFDGSKVTVLRHKGGYSMRARIPLEGLRIAEHQRMIGFDIHQISHDPQGKVDLLLAWAGNKRSTRFTASYGLLFIEA